MPTARVLMLVGAELLWSGDADRIEREAERAGFGAECAPLVEWLRDGGELPPRWPYRRLAGNYRDHIEAGGLPPATPTERAV